ncbi:RelA/SpoT family protein [Sphingomonas sp. AR_OL41]|uniref:RelA/SpoT family protein n=1 Tax=Sphingomonas sp. AR_OL41 TaxID=3042729 RepID=UPI002480A83D|nr:RelA/SpoT family protein [Sphingomonas sp. AR_OL41]MDH7973995.1 RelA/SpoT family protein [Sphingomonas sp. AR_OL41]
MRIHELVDRVLQYDPDANEALLNRAYVFSINAHGAQKRALSDPYFSHQLGVAGILTDFHLDDETIATAILHDTIEDTVATPEEITRLFGPSVARLVDGVTRLSKIEAHTENERAAENLRKFLLAMSDDIRVLLVKLADRLHNMRTLHFIESEDKRRRIARETLDIYAPLAERIGMYEFMKEMQTLAFKELEPEAYESIAKRLEQLTEGGGNKIAKIGSALKLLLVRAGIEAEVLGREKPPYLIWKKMMERHVSFEQLSDIITFHVVVADVQLCYQGLGLIQSRWPMVPGRFKDYISTPKRNGYRALHTTVIHANNTRVEIKICTPEMRGQAEFGVAARWAYKEDKVRPEAQANWIGDLIEILDNANSPEELLEHTRMAMYQDRIFAFTPKGELHQLPKGATALDFGYSVHTDLGNQSVGAKVNGKVVSLRTVINNGDQVQILRSKSQEPQAIWLNFVITAKARYSIRSHFRKIDREDEIISGEKTLENIISPYLPIISNNKIEEAAKRAKYRDIRSFMSAIGSGKIKEGVILKSFFPEGENLTKNIIDSTSLAQNPRVPIFIESPDGRIAPGVQITRVGGGDPEGFARRHALVRESLLGALNASSRGKTQAIEIADTIRKALRALGNKPDLMQSEKYIVYSKSLRREMKYHSSLDSSKPPLSERQRSSLFEWLDADTALVALDDGLSVCEDAIYQRRFGPVQVERNQLRSLLDEIKKSGIATSESLDILTASVSNLPEDSNQSESDLKISGHIVANFFRAFGRSASKIWASGTKIAKESWHPGIKFIHWINGHADDLIVQFPTLKPIIEFLSKWFN